MCICIFVDDYYNNKFILLFEVGEVGVVLFVW